MSTTSAEGPLAGIRVLDLTRVLAGPYCTMTFGDMGADVIKVEQPGRGDDTRHWGPPYVGELSAYFLGVNRNKRSITLNLKSERGKELLAEVIKTSDVVIDNFKLGTLEEWGFGPGWYEEVAPHVVRCSITGYGSTGPKAGMPGYDFILQAETGLMMISGESDQPPVKMGVAIVDICTGMMATIAILGALKARERTDRGQHCEVSLHDTGVQLLANVASNYLASEEEAQRHGNGHPNIVPYRSYRAQDGDIAIAVGNDAQFKVFCESLDHPEWATDPRFEHNRDRVENRSQLDNLVGEIILTSTRDRWIERLGGAGIPAGPINRVSEALNSPQTTARKMVVEAIHPDLGPFRTLGLPFRLSETPPSIRRPPAKLGAHTSDILEELGITDTEEEQLRAEGVV